MVQLVSLCVLCVDDGVVLCALTRSSSSSSSSSSSAILHLECVVEEALCGEI